MPRRAWIRPILIAAAILFAVGVAAPAGVMAKDGGNSGSGSGNSGGGGGKGGSGSGNSGHGGGGDDGGGKGGGGGGDDDGGGKGRGGGGGDDDDDNGGRGDDRGGGGGRDDRGGGGGGSGGPGPGQNQGKGKGRGGSGNWDNSGSNEVRGAVSRGTALPLNRVMPVVRKAVPGKVLDVDLQQWSAGGWVYKFLVLNGEGKYSEVFVDASHNRIVRVRQR